MDHIERSQAPLQLTQCELAIYERLPRPPPMSHVSVTNIWIVEWLLPGDRQTGSELHQWLNQKRPGWAAYTSCASKEDVLAAIGAATRLARASPMRPILHIESHGNDDGFVGHNEMGGPSLLTWRELTPALQALNEATQCNLVVIAAACKGEALILALTEGPRAPAAAIVGPNANVTESDLLRATKELYRRQLDPGAHLSAMAESASRETSGVELSVESFAALAHESLLQQLIVSLRTDQRQAQIARLRARLRAETTLPDDEIERRLAAFPSLPSPQQLQAEWDTLFMVDLNPRNAERFGVNMSDVHAKLSAYGQRTK